MTIRTIPLIIDQMRAILVESNGSPYTQRLRMVCNDDMQFNFDVVTVDPATQALTPFAFDESTVFRIVAKEQKDYTGQELILADADKWNIHGHRSDLNVSQGKLSVRFKLNLKTLSDKLGKDNPSIKVVIDVEAVTVNGEISTLVQLDQESILNHVARNPTQIDNQPVEYMTLEDLRAELRKVTHPDGGTYKIEGDVFLLDVIHEDFVRIGVVDGSVSTMEDPS